MALSSRIHHSKIYRGTMDEIMKHRDEISDIASVELKVFELQSEEEFDGRSLADVLHEIGTVKGLPADLTANPKYMISFGISDKPQAHEA